ncbi:LytR/AlgR family response regulator transcription factor [uncultured Fibrella sp.]|uniref:LytR/AlgR family response regulator transcription factor n=1 Tax=uncultured Fibrella sp. TaxID=1284596 RepID=UPI0035CBB44F
MIRCLIVDDEPLAREVLENFIDRTPALQLIQSCSSALQAFEVLHHQPVDLLFLDIKMPGINGLDFIKSLRAAPAVIFTTAFAEYAMAGFELDAIDYLLKPISYERFCRGITKLLKLHPPQLAVPKAYTYFKIDGQLVKIAHTDLLYAKSVKDYVLLRTLNGKYLTHMTMKYLTQLLPSPPFFRVHRSYLVNKSFVHLADKSSITIGDTIIPVGESYKHSLGQID